MHSRHHTHICVLLAAFCLFLAYYSYDIYLNMHGPDAISCTAGCSTVQFSTYGTFAGIPVSVLGAVLFTLQALILAWHAIHPHKRVVGKLVHASFIIAPLGAFAFIGIQKFVLGAWCQQCLVVDVGALLGAAFWWGTLLLLAKPPKPL